MAARKPGAYAKILDAASRVFEKQGYHGSTVQDIADAAQLTKGGIYHYLKSKEEALFGINERVIKAALSEVLAITGNDELSVEERLRETILAIAVQHDTSTSDLRVSLREFYSLTPGYREQVIGIRDDLERVVKALLAEGVSTGVIVDDDPDLMAKYIFGSLNWMSVWHSPSGGVSGRDIGEKFADYILNGLLRSRA